ncbi:MAG: oxidoreductase, partial [Actinomycetota bacterium]
MGFSDRIRRFFSKRANPELSKLEQWVQGRRGLEGYIEPRTATNPTTLLMVDRDGDYLRAPVREPEEAIGFCNALGIPVYDAAVMGYPDRMKGRPRREEVEIRGDI